MATTVLFNDFDFTTSPAPWTPQIGVTLAVTGGELVVTPNSAFLGAVYANETDFRYGDLVTVSGKAHGSAAFECDVIIWDTSDPNGWTIIVNKDVSHTTTSTQFSVPITVPLAAGKVAGDIVKLQFGLLVGSSGGASGYFDDIRITKGGNITIPVFAAYYNQLNQG